MKRLSDDELIFNAQKVSEHGTPHLLSFARTSKDHARICKLPTVLKTLPSDFVVKGFKRGFSKFYNPLSGTNPIETDLD